MERSFLAGRKPSATLWPALEEVMAEVESLSAIVVGIGPGSYNGSRVGIAAAQGLALVHGCEVAPICSFEGVKLSGEAALAIGDARRGSFSLQVIRQGQVDGDFTLVEKEELEQALEEAQANEREVFSFDEATRFPIAENWQNLIQRRQSQASLLIEAFLRRDEEEQAMLMNTAAEPFYLRDPHITIGKRKSLLER